MVKLHKSNAQNTYLTLSEMSKNPDFIKAAEKIKKGQESMIKAMYNIDE